jgi:hypothetical protein
LTALEVAAFYAPHALAYFRSVNFERLDGLGSIFERFDQASALRIARGLGIVREYVRGDADVLRDIGRSFELYEQMFPGSKGE